MNNIEQSLTDIERNIGRRIYHSRILLGYSRKELAAEIGVTGQQLAKYESARNRVPLSRLMLISRVVGRGMDYFLECGAEYEELALIDRDVPRLSSKHLSLMKKLLKIKSDKQKKALIMLVDSLI